VEIHPKLETVTRTFRRRQRAVSFEGNSSLRSSIAHGTHPAEELRFIALKVTVYFEWMAVSFRF
jgi:hypothetical protein